MAVSSDAPKRDKADRPIVAITGMGIVTPLGVGKTGQLGGNCRLASRVSAALPASTTDGLRTTIAWAPLGTTSTPITPLQPALTERIALMAGEEAIAQAGIGGRGHFPGPLFLAAMLPVEVEWHYRIEDG